MQSALEEQVILDLKRRGYKVIERVKYGIVAAKGDRKALFMVFREGVGIDARELASALNFAETIKLPLILALVSNDGSVTYYMAFRLRLPRISREGTSQIRQEPSSAGGGST